MKKLALSLAAAAALAVVPSVASAQITDQGSITVSANIQPVLDFGVATPLSFGSVTPGVAATGTGSIPLTRNVGAVITLPDAATTGELTGPGGTIVPSYTCGLGTTASAITTPFSSCTPATAGTAVATLTAPTGQVTSYVIFSGSLTAAQTNTMPGSYSGTIRVLATQN